MSETAMALGNSDLERIGAYVKGHLYGWFVEVAPHMIIGPQLLERIATIEQELKDQRELMAVRFDAMDGSGFHDRPGKPNKRKTRFGEDGWLRPL